MSKPMTESQLRSHIIDAVRSIENLLSDWACSCAHDKKRAQLLAYWVKAYTSLLRRETSFNPSSLPRLSRRQIVNVDFGFRVGSELGGLHYAVVLDKENAMRSQTVTVVPLGSLKQEKQLHKSKIVLHDGVYAALQCKVDLQLKEAKTLLNDMLSDASLQNLPADLRAEEIDRRSTLAKKKLTAANTSLAKMNKLKQGTIANVSQVTTISKMRIKEPVVPGDALYGVKVSEQDMAQIERAVLEFYISKGIIKNFTSSDNA